MNWWGENNYKLKLYLKKKNNYLKNKKKSNFNFLFLLSNLNRHTRSTWYFVTPPSSCLCFSRLSHQLNIKMFFFYFKLFILCPSCACLYNFLPAFRHLTPVVSRHSIYTYIYNREVYTIYYILNLAYWKMQVLLLCLGLSQLCLFHVKYIFLFLIKRKSTQPDLILRDNESELKRLKMIHCKNQQLKNSILIFLISFPFF